MSLQAMTYLVVGMTFALYIGIAIWSRAASTKDFYVAGSHVHPVANGMATAADWMSAASFISMAGLISFSGYDASVYLMGWTGGYVLLALLLANGASAIERTELTPVPQPDLSTMEDATSGKLQMLQDRIAELINSAGDEQLAEAAAGDLVRRLEAQSASVESVEQKPYTERPQPPFTTSTLQQEANRKYGFTARQTMQVAQSLYENGHITYMRTDSTNLATVAVDAARDLVRSEYGERYLPSAPRVYKSKVKNAQEAHEAIRPTYLNQPTVNGNRAEQRLYELIWKRTIASQMSEAQLEKTTITIAITGAPEKFVATGEVLKFDGFLKVYLIRLRIIARLHIKFLDTGSNILSKRICGGQKQN